MTQANFDTATNFAPAIVPVVSVAATLVHPPAVRRFTVDEFHRLGEIGILEGDERLELLEGVIMMMSPIGLAHAKTVSAAHESMQRIAGKAWHAVCQQPIRLGLSEPVPDVTVLRGNLRNYVQLPQSKDIGLVIEVSDATLQQDRLLKSSIYAAAEIPTYWIINLVDRKLEVYCKPIAASGDLPARYESIDVLGPEATVDLILDGTKLGSINAADFFP